MAADQSKFTRLAIKYVAYEFNRTDPRHARRALHAARTGSGRTGRAGEEGLAISFLTPESLAHWSLIEKRHAVKLPQESIPGYEATTEAPEPLENNGGVKGKRPSKKDKLRQLAASNAEN